MLKQRIITALILLPIVLGGFFGLTGAAFALFTGSVIALGAWEWAQLAGYSAPKTRVGYACGVALLLLALYCQPLLAHWVLIIGVAWWLLAVFLVLNYPSSRSFWAWRPLALSIGLVLLLPAWQGLQIIKALPQGNALILLLMLLIWSADIGAYFAGRRFGRHKLAPEVSPGKTWEGAQGGLLASLLVTIVAGLGYGWAWQEWLLILPGILIVVAFSILGDLTESMFKRSVGVKDSSQLLPGHGGILDRIDSLTAAIPVFTFLLCLVGWGA